VTSPSPERNGKAALRAQLLLQRDRLPAEVRGAGEAAIAARAEEPLRALAPGDVVALYAGKGSEVDPLPLDALARRLGLRVAYPRVVKAQRYLAFHLAEPGALVAASFGLREPPPHSAELPLEEIRCFFVPGIGFDERGGRLGWGRGYYDHTFTRAPRALRLGLGFECQVVEHVPQAEHDIPLHGLFTEARARRFGT
jgi:5-formyltetrahydrofolate cyclo-ligase